LLLPRRRRPLATHGRPRIRACGVSVVETLDDLSDALKAQSDRISDRADRDPSGVSLPDDAGPLVDDPGERGVGVRMPRGDLHELLEVILHAPSLPA
jgi:hypothetical protein